MSGGLTEGIDATTPAGRLPLHVLAAIAEFERSRIQERVRAGLARVKAQGKRLGRPVVDVSEERLAPVRGLSVREAARRLGVSPATAHRWLSRNTSAISISKPAEYGLNRSPRSGDFASHPTVD